MKTESINDCIDRVLAITRDDHVVYRDVVERSVASARAELTAIESENAALREALGRTKKWIDIGVGEYLPKWMHPAMAETYDLIEFAILSAKGES